MPSFAITNCCLSKKILYILCTIVVLRIIFYYAGNYITQTEILRFVSPSRLPLLCSPNSTRQSLLSGIICDQCRLSLKESDGWFCEFDDEWQRRKHIHHIQDQRNHVSDERSYFFLNNWEPTIHCAFERRFGLADGGKWICDVHKLRISNSIPPLVYSFGSNNNFNFEKAVKEELPNSEIHTFDLNLYTCPVNVCVFHQALLGDGGNDGSKSLRMIIDELNHWQRDIDILKIDIEGSEFKLFQELFNSVKNTSNTKYNSQSKKLPYIRQILVEIHLGQNTTEEESREAHSLFEAFRLNYYAIFHKEANIGNCQNVFEYALIRLNPKFFN